MTLDVNTRKRWRFFLEHAGYATPPGRAACALKLARAEALLDEAESLELARFTLEADPEPYDPGDVATDNEARELFASGRWTGPFGAVLDVGPFSEPGCGSRDDASSSVSLWGIVVGPEGSSDPYMRTVRAELASEAEDELRQALVDAAAPPLEVHP